MFPLHLTSHLNSKTVARNVASATILALTGVLGACASNTCAVTNGKHVTAQAYAPLRDAGTVKAPAVSDEYYVPPASGAAPATVADAGSEGKRGKTGASRCLDFPVNHTQSVEDAEAAVES